MYIGRVSGVYVASAKDKRMNGISLFHIEKLGMDMKPTGGTDVAADGVGVSGDGDVVLVAGGSSARLTDRTKDTPVDKTIMAIVDRYDVDGKTLHTA